MLFIHIAAVVGWVGAAMLRNFVLVPVLPMLSPAGRADFGKVPAPKLSRYSLMMAGVAMLDGVVLIAYLQFLAPASEAMSSTASVLLGVGALIGLLVAVSFAWLQSMTKKKTEALAAQMARSPAQAGELGAKLAGIQKSSTRNGRIAFVLLLFVLVLMVVGTNV